MLHYPFPLTISDFADILQNISIQAGILTKLPVSPHIQQQHFLQNRLKSSLFSAKIEGGTLTLEQFQTTTPSKQKQEVMNIASCLNSLPSLPNTLSEKDIVSLHNQIMSGISGELGMRHEQTAIFDSSGAAVYLTPAIEDMKNMLTTLLEESHKTKTPQESIIHACVSHYYFEKIHPFVDGNGRTGRVLFQYELQKTKLFGECVVPVDEYIEQHLHQYYDLLERNTRNVHDFVQFMLDALLFSLQTMVQEVTQLMQQTSELPNLPPRRQEILAIIQDHPYISFDAIARRFPSIPRRTLSNDVAQLLKQKRIKKYGVTRGVLYSIA